MLTVLHCSGLRGSSRPPSLCEWFTRWDTSDHPLIIDRIALVTMGQGPRTQCIPVRMDRDDRYFTDTYQAMPRHGYTRMFENMLDHPNITIMLDTDYRDVLSSIRFRELVYTGPVDEFFDYRFGKLPYRSLRFRHETFDVEKHQPAAVINYPNENDYTRVTEFKYLTGQAHAKTSVVYEYPCDGGDPYYPVPRPENAAIYKRYEALAASTPQVHFVGRLATYKYYNMDQVVAQALTLCAKLYGATRRDLVRKPSPFPQLPLPQALRTETN